MVFHHVTRNRAATEAKKKQILSTRVKKKKKNEENRKENATLNLVWILKVALRPSGVLLVEIVNWKTCHTVIQQELRSALNVHMKIVRLV